MSDQMRTGREPKGHIWWATCDITTLSVDAIVNAANRFLLGGGGVDGAIHRAAGPELLKECIKLHGCKVGEAKITGGGNLKARYVIHTVGPKYKARNPRCEQLLYNCYYHSLELAKQYEIRSIAFPAISTGAYGYPEGAAAEVALRAISKWISDHPDYEIDIVVCCLDSGMRRHYENASNTVWQHSKDVLQSSGDSGDGM
jgi:O-acetyl-ADP-ribose deacetylase (regulator of RNase III)